MTIWEKVIESLSQELNDSKYQLLKFFEEHNKWEKEIYFLILKIDVLNENQIILEKAREEEEKEGHVKQVIQVHKL